MPIERQNRPHPSKQMEIQSIHKIQPVCSQLSACIRSDCKLVMVKKPAMHISHIKESSSFQTRHLATQNSHSTIGLLLGPVYVASGVVSLANHLGDFQPAAELSSRSLEKSQPHCDHMQLFHSGFLRSGGVKASTLQPWTAAVIWVMNGWPCPANPPSPAAENLWCNWISCVTSGMLLTFDNENSLCCYEILLKLILVA